MIRTEFFSLPDYDRREILRYMGCRSSNEETDALIDRSISELDGVFSGRVCYGEFDVEINGDTVDFGFASVSSRALAKNLSGCRKAVVFGATVGIEIDRKIAKYGRFNPSVAVCMQAIGAERIAALCEAFCATVEGAGTRFSPGYGDLPLDFQRDIFRVLGCPSRIGLTLIDSMLMSPTKSVTAIVGKRENEV